MTPALQPSAVASVFAIHYCTRLGTKTTEAPTAVAALTPNTKAETISTCCKLLSDDICSTAMKEEQYNFARTGFARLVSMVIHLDFFALDVSVSV